MGWKGDSKTVYITNCLYAPAPLAAGEDYVSGGATFCCQHNDQLPANITNCYYTQSFGAAQGNQARAISGGEHVTLANVGTPVVTYTTSGITSYGTGIKYNNVFYASVGDEVSLTLSSDQPAEGYSFSGYNATPDGATLTGSDANGWTLTMPDADVTIGAVYSPVTYSITYELGGGALPEGRANPESYTVESEAFTLVNPERDGYVFAGWTGGGFSEPSTEVTIAKGSTTGDKTFTATWQMPPIAYIDVDGYTQTCSDYTVLTGSEWTLAAGWYVADGTISFDHQLSTSGDIHLILKDGAVMNIGTEQSPVSYYGIDATESYSISIHGQSTGEHRGQLWINATGYSIYTEHDNSEISGCEVHAKGNDIGIFIGGGSLSMTDAVVTAEGTSREGIYIMNGNLTAQGCSITATTNRLHGIYAKDDITLTDCKVTAKGKDGIYVGNGNVEISGGQVTATGTNGYGIQAYGSITLSWNAPTDFIEASSYYASGGITLAKPFSDGDGNIYSGTVSDSDINGKKLLPHNGPFNLTATNITETSATLTWEAAGDETQWLVSWSTNGGSTWSTDITENECSYELTGLSVGTTVLVK
ncbi:MAG: InlB B-repeat-containing protein, partial [Prevotella sp.]|nr:InlB B-repeat-containing protein [Prevotella sp.]